MKIYLDIEPFDNDIQKHVITLFSETAKYKTLWYLRHLENEILSENGNIIIHVFHAKAPIVDTNGFSKNLADRMQNIICQIDYGIDLLR